MKLNIGGTIKKVAEGVTVKELLVLEQVETPEYVSVAVNEEFIPADAFADTPLKDGDTVEFLYFMGGGAQ